MRKTISIVVVSVLLGMAIVIPSAKAGEKKTTASSEVSKDHGQNDDGQKGETNRTVVGSCIVTASQPLSFIDRMPRVDRGQGSGHLGARITLTFDNTKGDASTLSISGDVLDATGLRYKAAWLDMDNQKPWDGKIEKGEIKKLKYLARLTQHKMNVGDRVRMVLVVTNEAGHKAELTSEPVCIVGAM